MSEPNENTNNIVLAPTKLNKRQLATIKEKILEEVWPIVKNIWKDTLRDYPTLLVAMFAWLKISTTASQQCFLPLVLQSMKSSLSVLRNNRIGSVRRMYTSKY